MNGFFRRPVAKPDHLYICITLRMGYFNDRRKTWVGRNEYWFLLYEILPKPMILVLDFENSDTNILMINPPLNVWHRISRWGSIVKDVWLRWVPVKSWEYLRCLKVMYNFRARIPEMIVVAPGEERWESKFDGNRTFVFYKILQW